jgi:DNA-binding FadR family transcriptional regulator
MARRITEAKDNTTSPSARPDNAGLISSQVAALLAKAIASGVYDRVGRLPTEAELCEKYNVSRTAMREAIRTLSAKGMLTAKPRAGTRINPKTEWNRLDPDLLEWMEDVALDDEFVKGLMETRMLLEPAAAFYAAERANSSDLARIETAYLAMCEADPGDVNACVDADVRFHLAVLAAAHNPVFLNMGAMIKSALRSVFSLAASAPDVFADSLSAHGDILEAIRMRKPQAARSKMEEVLKIGRHDLEEVLGEPL